MGVKEVTTLSETHLVTFDGFECARRWFTTVSHTKQYVCCIICILKDKVTLPWQCLGSMMKMMYAWYASLSIRRTSRGSTLRPERKPLLFVWIYAIWSRASSYNAKIYCTHDQYVQTSVQWPHSVCYLPHKSFYYLWAYKRWQRTLTYSQLRALGPSGIIHMLQGSYASINK